MTFLLSCLAFASGWLLSRVLYREPASIVIRRERAPWIERNGVRERADFTTEQTAVLLDRLAAKDRRIAELEAKVRELRMEPESLERELRLVRG